MLVCYYAMVSWFIKRRDYKLTHSVTLDHKKGAFICLYRNPWGDIIKRDWMDKEEALNGLSLLTKDAVKVRITASATVKLSKRS